MYAIRSYYDFRRRFVRDRRDAVGRPVPEVDEDGAVHMPGGGMQMMHGADHSMHMPGMLSPEQMQELEARITSYNVCYTKLLRFQARLG